jgi:predicted small integral membrane protein
MWTWIHAQWQVFAGLGVFLAAIPAIAVYDVLKKPVPRKGFLGLESTPGLRFFIGMLAFIFIHIGWMLIVPHLPIVIPFVVSVILLFAIFIWG